MGSVCIDKNISRQNVKMYSIDFRKLAKRIFHKEGSYRRAAKICGISSSTLHRWVNTQTTDKTKVQRTRRKLTSHVVDLVSKFIDNYKGITNLSRIQKFVSSHGIPLSLPSLRFAIKKLCRRSWKKTSKRFGGEKGTRARDQAIPIFCDRLKATLSDNRELIVCIDECYFSEKVLPLYGYGKIGEKLVVESPVASWKKRSLLLAVASDGSYEYVIHDGSINKCRFSDFIDGLSYARGTTIILDNVAFHKDTSHMVAKGYNPIFSPPYSPDHNGPVENSFSVIKSAFRDAWPWNDGVDQAIVEAIDNLDPTSIKMCFRHLKHVVGFEPRAL